MDAVINAISAFAEWLFGIVKDFIAAAVEFLKDVFVWALDGILTALADIITAIPVPDFLTQYSLGVLFGQMHPVIGYFGAELHIAQGLAILAAAFTFRMTRKALTLFQW